MYENLKALRESLNMKQKDMAAALNLAPNTYNINVSPNPSTKLNAKFTVRIAARIGPGYLMPSAHMPFSSNTQDKVRKTVVAQRDRHGK